ncbi:TPA: cysteine desulfurase [Patescibacteria group bacterium]|uniref:Cysteine desulfurase n=1 Tax=Candidatus Gottesmanbacteria bacterium GW2011_GWA1_43_11 TaxID=1618436 RepID=A0A0G1CFB3_9BACT|nr:MAG: Cysteine desulfurase, SufS subfamily [Candidatus Gottesmanbacteria bacterium GW2011_GWA1_43_11]HCS78373.1 cysteine desulfurase [Patescibacteria group bacterium]
MFNPQRIKADFPIFKNLPQLIYLDSAASSFKPQLVLDKLNEYYTNYPVNISRGIYKLSEKATQEYEGARKKVAQFINAETSEEIIFTRNTTESINLVMYAWGMPNIKKGDEIVITIMEHHANFVTWQQLCKFTGARLKIAKLRKDYTLDTDDLLSKITPLTKLVAFTHVSNVLGTINPVAALIKQIKARNPHCLILVDGAQAIPHLPVDIAELGCDFYVFSSHKMLGPTGTGVLWGRYELLDQLKPFQYGGEMIQAVYRDRTEFQPPPHKFEAGTPDIAGVIGLGAAVDYLNQLGMQAVRMHEQEMVAYGSEQLAQVKGLHIIGPTDPKIRGGVLTFTIDKIHAHDIAQVLDSNNICIRSGHHCAMPLHIELGLVATARASVHVFTSKSDIDALMAGLMKVKKLFS